MLSHNQLPFVMVSGLSKEIEMKKINSRAQSGSVLIVVLVMLVLLTLVGTWAIRGSINSLKISTNAQAQALLKQASDSVFYTLENKTDNQLTLAQMRGGDGMLGYVMRPENKGKEMVFCIRGSVADNFSGGRIASVVYWQGSTIKNADAGKNGFCQKSRLTDFLSGRNAVMTQVSIRSAENERDWEDMLEGDDKDTSKSIGKPRVAITVTSIIPNFSEASTTEINTCLSNFTSFSDTVTKNETVTDCLAGKNVPYSTQQMEYILQTLSGSSS